MILQADTAMKNFKEIVKMTRRTRFQKEISGELGDFWKNHAQKEVEDAVKSANERAVVEEDGAIKWVSNNHYIPDDFCEKLEYAGYNFDRESTRIKADKQSRENIQKYIANQKYYAPTEEQILEMRSIFGEGVTVVDVFTGRTLTT